MSREDYVHLPGIQFNFPSRLRTFLVQAVAPYSASLISPVQRNDPYNGSRYILHGTLILAVRPH